MSRWTLADIADCLGQPLGSFSPESVVESISTDSRTLEKGSLFVPLVGENFDGHDYAQRALESSGASAIVWGRSDIPEWLTSLPSVPVFKVDDTLLAYQRLGLYWKKRCAVRAVAVTGSVGKTTTKEILAHLLSCQFNVHKSQANFNNDIGVPKTLLELTPEHEIVVVEMGMRGLGEIARLVEAAEPEIGVITAIGTSHLELLGSRENIARAKGELVAGLPSQGWAVLPSKDDFFPLLCQLAQGRLSPYSANPGDTVGLFPSEILAEDADGTTFALDENVYRLPLPGRHHLHDLFAALSVGKCLGVPLVDMLATLPTLEHAQGRAEWTNLGGARFFVDAYNSAPESLRASLGVLRNCQGRRLAVLADMLELGDLATQAHQEAGDSLREFEVDLALCTGPLSAFTVETAKARGVKAMWFENKLGLTDFLAEELRQGDFVLVKASRGMSLETAVSSMQ